MFAIPLLAFSILVLDRPPKVDEAQVAFQKKLHGEWNGQGGCEGQIAFNSDGTFKRTNYGPGHMSVTGTWEIKWDTTPPTLRMIQTASDVEGFEKHTEEGKLIMLDNESFVLASDEDLKNGNQRKFSRPKKRKQK